LNSIETSTFAFCFAVKPMLSKLRPTSSAPGNRTTRNFVSRPLTVISGRAIERLIDHGLDEKL